MAELPSAPTTMLEAVNMMLASVGRALVASLDQNDMNEESLQAVAALGRTNREVQSRGWQFNTEEAYPLLPDATTQRISVPANVIRFTSNIRSWSVGRVTRRGQDLYNLSDHTYQFTPASPFYADVTFLFDFETIPEPFRWWITAKSARLFATGKDPSKGTYQFTKQVEDEAEQNALHYDDDERRTGLGDTNSHFGRMRLRR